MLGTLALRGFSFAYGLVGFVLLTATAALRDGAFTRNRRPSEKEDEEFEKGTFPSRLVSAHMANKQLAQKLYWDLSNNPLPGFKHMFYKLENGVQLHYVTNAVGPNLGSGKNVAIFIHGFPDSYVLWRKILTSPALSSHILIAVDLPGYGGSDSLEKYDPDHVLETMTWFILGMREQYLSDGGKLIMVTHDWGTIVGARLASEANQLADRWILANGVIPQHVRSTVQSLLASSRQMLHTFMRNPTNTALLRKSFSTVGPMFSQLGQSFYVFTLNLPMPLSSFVVRMGNFWFVRLLLLVQAEKEGTGSETLGELLAASFGPALPGEALQSSNPDHQYGESVMKRIPDHGMSQKIRVYREGLALSPWTKSLEAIAALSEISRGRSFSASGRALFDDGPPGALKVPATLVWGNKDPAGDRRLALSGLSDYLTRRSDIVMVKEGGHWLPTEEVGAKVIADVTEWALTGEKTPLKEKLVDAEGITIQST
ncbi:alpha/beta-hydrolase [Westerdykella ornata]|uniref:Alpha/beta-hydrolase n=1 Tax=Westerdykella ornata TaxID=318751 RepID=A0A6A6JGQ4_WESOR|nr:alpha/beta-hydrolase [Westerdykella ornata]KAF2275445.1 alpha/beta-hydrolase [Westerdykella ornata]